MGSVNAWRVGAYSCGLLIVILAIPVALVQLEAMPLLLVVAVFALLVAGVLWTWERAVTLDADHKLFVKKLSRETPGIRRAVLFDETSGLYQPWYLELRLTEEIARCARHELSLALIVVKLGQPMPASIAINGWQDDSSQAAYTTSRIVRTFDLTAALGPSEFAVCLLHCDADGAELARTRLMNVLKDYEPSSGVVVYPLEKGDAKELIKLARSRAESLRSRAA